MQALVPQQTELSALEAAEAVGFAVSHLGAGLFNEWMEAKPGAVIRPPLQNYRDIIILAETLGFGLGAQFAGRRGSHLQQAGKIAVIAGMSPTVQIFWDAGQFYFKKPDTPAARGQRGNNNSNRGNPNRSRPQIEIVTGPQGASETYSSAGNGNGTSRQAYW